jgi:hypothetical protein
MDWIERLFHVSPDGGSGSFELGIALGVLVALAMIAAGAVKLGPRLQRWCQRLASPSADRANR